MSCNHKLLWDSEAVYKSSIRICMCWAMFQSSEITFLPRSLFYAYQPYLLTDILSPTSSSPLISTIVLILFFAFLLAIRHVEYFRRKTREGNKSGFGFMPTQTESNSSCPINLMSVLWYSIMTPHQKTLQVSAEWKESAEGKESMPELLSLSACFWNPDWSGTGTSHHLLSQHESLESVALTHFSKNSFIHYSIN